MKKTKYFYLLFTLFFVFQSLTKGTAQTAKITIAKFEKTEQPGFEIQYTAPIKVVRKALLKKLKADGISVKKRRKEIICKGIKYSAFAHKKIDLYFQLQ